MIKQMNVKLSLMSKLTLLLLSLLSISSFAKDPVGFYYQNTFDMQMLNYEKLILNAEAFSEEEISLLKDHGTEAIAYLSVGETESHNLVVGNGEGPGGYASWYIDVNPADNLPDKNPNWGSYYVNVGDPAWQSYLFNRVDELAYKGVSGLFLDTVDIVDVIPDSRFAMVALIKSLNEKVNSTNFEQTYGKRLSIVQNRGFSIIENTAVYLDAVLFEGLTGSYDHTSQSYILADTIQTDNVARRLNQIQRHSYFEIWSLDYLNQGDSAALKMIIERSQQYQFTTITSDIDISRFDNINLNSANAKPEGLLDTFSVTESDAFTVFEVISKDTLDLSAHRVQILINSQKGHASYIEEGITADYMLENGTLYQYSGNGGNWLWDLVISDAVQSQQSDSYRVSLQNIQFGLGQNESIEVLARVFNDNETLVEISPVVRLVSETTQYVRQDELDSSLVGSQDIISVVLEQTGFELKLSLSLREAMGSTEHYSFYIDTNDLSGYQFYDISASYMLKDGHLYQYTGDGVSWSWQWLKWLPLNINGTSLGYSLSLSDISLLQAQSFEVIVVTENADWQTTDQTKALQAFIK
ncbi:endo alpha-1,4 polygalactosaminidase [Pseudoalteromonas denitrificans]|uniref:Extracellular protein n=1 Tax=Pseudoalteromonas denitrificans DSM 6059 TaxID=1123010 RepID=A0A1I1M0P5_9GAMM|nr:endo alpha-1,4 polygalactosaminidase [Pseudoalteromonas denitrificans]SFC78322.1 extracellular protein [Pseudoalteromonas denitrificans DSM 6059]